MCIHAEHDTGILWSSCRLNLHIDNPMVSDRDSAFVALDEFESPFI